MSFLQRLFGPPNVEKLQVKGNIKGLIKALGYEKDWKIRSTAAKSLGELGDKQAVSPLISALNDTRLNVRQAAAEALGKIGDAQAVEPLVAMLQDRSEKVRLVAVKTLTDIGAPAVEPLISTLHKGNSDVRALAAQTLGKLDENRATEELILALQDPQWGVRQAAAEALGQIGNPQAVEPLIATFQDSSRAVNLAATAALTDIGTPAVEPLASALQDTEWSVRQFAAKALKDLNWQPPDGEIKVAYWIAVGEWDRCADLGPPAVPALIVALKEEETCQPAIETLSKIGTPAIEPLTVALGDETPGIRQAAAEVLKEIGDAQTVEPLISTLKDKDKTVRLAAIKALAEVGSKLKDITPRTRVVESLIVVLKDGDEDMTRVAVGAIEPLIAFLDDQEIHSAARKALKNYRAKVRRRKAAEAKDVARRKAEKAKALEAEVNEAISILHEAHRGVWHPTQDLVKAIIILGQAGDPESIETLEDALHDQDYEVRQAAALALRQIEVSSRLS